MPISLSAYFNHRGGALFLAAMLVSPYASLAGSAPRPDAEEQDLSIALLVPQSRICVGLKSVFNPHTPVERYLARQYFGTQRTKIGRLLLNAEEAEPLQVCYDRALDKA
ncbi:MAG: hypothetical protein JWO78_1178, partial [Micavibrio sp.]|nr:hypothetical protein [Micavibrio sp.]